MDWKRIIKAIEDAGVTRSELAVRVGSSRPTIWRLATGVTTDPPWSTGNAILSEYARLDMGIDVGSGFLIEHGGGRVNGAI